MIDSVYDFLSSFLQFHKKFFTEGRSEQCLPLNVPARHWTGRNGGYAKIRQIANLRGKSHREWANSGVGSAGSGVLPDRAEADAGPLLGGALVPPIGMPFGRRLHGPRRDWRADCRTLDARDGKLYAECGGDLVYRPAGAGSLHGGAGYCDRWKGRSVGGLISWLEQKPSFFKSIFLQLDNCKLISSFSNFVLKSICKKRNEKSICKKRKERKFMVLNWVHSSSHSLLQDSLSRQLTDWTDSGFVLADQHLSNVYFSTNGIHFSPEVQIRSFSERSIERYFESQTLIKTISWMFKFSNFFFWWVFLQNFATGRLYRLRFPNFPMFFNCAKVFSFGFTDRAGSFFS